MMFLSTRGIAPAVSFHDALFQGLTPDGGLYVPEQFPRLPSDVFLNLEKYTLSQLSEIIMQDFLPEIPVADLHAMINKAISFPIPLVELENQLYLLEVFHGPTLAFKDVGARFMANVLSYFLTKENKHLSIVVATSGDTGSAIAHAFHHVPHISVYILYPSGKISTLQEQQMTTLGGNVHALEVEGTFDDCQMLVKTALMDADVRAHQLLTTANSINIARLLPQIIYHSWGVCQLRSKGITANPIMVVPSGNLGNLTAAVYAKQIGFPVDHFIAATNTNDVFPQYLATGEFSPQPSKQSYSNAMDVGNPSNIERLQFFYRNEYKKMQKEVRGFSVSNEQTLAMIRQTYTTTGYILDPHTAVGVATALHERLNAADGAAPIIVTATAHPAKFPEVIKRAIDVDIELPERLRKTLDLPKQSTKISPHYAALKSILLKSNSSLSRSP